LGNETKPGIVGKNSHIDTFNQEVNVWHEVMFVNSISFVFFKYFRISSL
jgi:hypothetical protein